MLEDRRFWIFDLDGTLTLAKHDFDEMRRALKLPPGGPILEALATLPESEAREKRRLLDEIEWEIATIAEPQPGAGELLGQLNRNGARLGILTRNTLANALHTLEACGLSQYFSTEDIVSQPGGDHRFSDIERHLEAIALWLAEHAPGAARD